MRVFNKARTRITAEPTFRIRHTPRLCCPLMPPCFLHKIIVSSSKSRKHIRKWVQLCLFMIFKYFLSRFKLTRSKLSHRNEMAAANKSRMKRTIEHNQLEKIMNARNACNGTCVELKSLSLLSSSIFDYFHCLSSHWHLECNANTKLAATRLISWDGAVPFLWLLVSCTLWIWPNCELFIVETTRLESFMVVMSHHKKIQWFMIYYSNILTYGMVKILMVWTNNLVVLRF